MSSDTDVNTDDSQDDDLDDDESLQRDGPSANLRKALGGRGIRFTKSKSAKASGGSRKRARKTGASSKKRSSSKKNARRQMATESDQKPAGRDGYKKRHIRFPSNTTTCSLR